MTQLIAQQPQSILAAAISASNPVAITSFQQSSPRKRQRTPEGEAEISVPAGTNAMSGT
jgi:hypothetical protein